MRRVPSTDVSPEDRCPCKKGVRGDRCYYTNPQIKNCKIWFIPQIYLAVIYDMFARFILHINISHCYMSCPIISQIFTRYNSRCQAPSVQSDKLTWKIRVLLLINIIHNQTLLLEPIAMVTPLS